MSQYLYCFRTETVSGKTCAFSIFTPSHIQVKKCAGGGAFEQELDLRKKVLSVLALLVQKYKY
jgi:hypothetical protein